MMSSKTAELTFLSAGPDAPRFQESLRNRTARYGWAIFWIAVATAVYWPMEPIMAQGHDPSLLFLPVVIGCAVRLGFGPAILASILGFLAWDFMYIPPRFTLIVTTPQDYLALGVYLLAGITTAQLAAQARRQTQESEARGREIAMLYRIGQIVSGESNPDRMLDTLAQQIAQVCVAGSTTIFRIGPSGNLEIAAGVPARTTETREESDALLAAARKSLEPLVAETGPTNATEFFPLRLRDTPVGVLFVALPDGGTERSPRESATIAALSNYTAAVIARQNFTEQAQLRVQTAAVTEERNRLTREIHDTVAQSLTGIVILLQAADGADPEEKTAVITQAGHLAQDCLAEARRSVRALRPGALEGSDLLSALRNMVERTERSGGPRTTFQAVGEPYPLPTESEAHLFRIGQEALTNALRHARAQDIRVTLTYGTSEIELRVEDDGVGIDAIALTGHGFGMTSMQERADEMQGALHIGPTAAGCGTVVTITVPRQSPGETEGLSDHRTGKGLI